MNTQPRLATKITTWPFRLQHLFGLTLVLPMIALTRLWPGHWRAHEESVYVESNRAVLTALGFAYMA